MDILLAFSGDKGMYPSGAEIMSQTVDWPGNMGGFRASIDILRPLFKERLSELSFEAKEEAYLVSIARADGKRNITNNELGLDSNTCTPRITFCQFLDSGRSCASCQSLYPWSFGI
jgi:hypothetical protein